LPRITTTPGEGSSFERSTTINNGNISNRNIRKNANNRNSTSNKINRRTTRKLGDIPPVAGMCLLLALVTIIVAFVAGGTPWVVGVLAVVVLALASRIR
jgi:Flp pilus assembly protein TadB